MVAGPAPAGATPARANGMVTGIRREADQAVPLRWSHLGLGVLALALGWALPWPLGAAGWLAFALVAALDPRAAALVWPLTLPVTLYPVRLGALEFAPPEIAVASLALGFAARWLLDRWRGNAAALVLQPTPFDLAAAVFVAGHLLGLLESEYLRLSLRELRTVVAMPLLAYYLLVMALRGLDDARRLSAVVVVATGGVALASLAMMLANLGLTDAGGVRRLQGPYPSANHLALVLGRGLPFAVALAWPAGRWRPALLAAVAAMAAALGFSLSLGGWLGALAAMALVALLLGGWRPLLALGGGAVALTLGAVFLLRVERVLARLDPASGTTFFRLRVWEAGWRMVRDHPLLGVGMDNFLYRYRAGYMLPDAWREPNLSHPHNWVLQVWLQGGLVGLLGFLALVLVYGQRALLLLRAGVGARPLAAGAAGALAALLVHGSLDNSYYLPDLAYLFWIGCAILTVAGRRERDTDFS